MSGARLLTTALALALVLTAASQAEVVQRGNLRVHFHGRLAPTRLPRDHDAPVRVALGTRIGTTDGSPPPQLRSISIAINRHGRFDPVGLPLCALRQIQPATTRGALAACRDSLVGQGHFAARLLLNQQSPFPAQGKLYAFNGRIHGHPAILAHVFGKKPVPTSYTLPFEISPASGTYGTVLEVDLPRVTGSAGHITALSMNLGRGFSYRGRRHHYLSASCATPSDVGTASFPLARTTLGFAGGMEIGQTVTRSCRVR